ncbi:MAG TPA: MMPL family transporter, partial [Actinomycetales bacterium]|nr:MMPL family transporter [Actinomycetales bacterium]
MSSRRLSSRLPVRHITSKLWAAVTVILGLLFVGALTGLTANLDPGDSAPASLPDDAESAIVQDLGTEFPGGDQLSAIAVYSREDGEPLGPEDIGAAQASAEAMAGIDLPPSAMEQLTDYEGETSIEQVSPAVPLAEEAAQAVLTLPGDINGLGLADAVSDMRDAGKENLPDGLNLQLTGPAGFAADTASAFDGANFALLGISALVVAVLLILTYRSPILWLIPLLTVAIADRAASLLVELVASFTPLQFDGSTSGIMSVLVFGAGTNYALLLISRYREELRKHEDHRKALAKATRASTSAIVSSNLTVVFALLALALALVPSYRYLGISLSIGLLVALAFALFVLPAALSLFGRKLFWPKIPKVEDEDPKAKKSGWYRVADFVSERPGKILAGMVVLLALLGTGLFGANIGLSTTEQFRTESEAADGLDTIAEYTSAGAASPLSVIAPAGSADSVAEAIGGVDGAEIQGPPTESLDGELARFTVITDSEPATSESFEEIRDLRAAVQDADPETLVGGQSAQTLDTRDATERDTLLIIPIILAVILVLLMLILRAVVAPIFLLMATTLSAVAALGAGALVSEHIFGFPALDVSVPLYSLIFLIALGIDYTVFLVLRAKEEAEIHGTNEGMSRAVGLTGGVITAAGIVLAAVFAVLGVLPLITLGQVGIVVGLGILIDTFLVRTLVVPALFNLLGDRMWWPSKPPSADGSEGSGTEDGTAPDTATTSGAADSGGATA